MRIKILFGFEVVWVLFRCTDAYACMGFGIILQYFLKIRISHYIVKLVSVFNATHLAGFSFKKKKKSKTDDGAICIKEKHKENV